MKSKSDFEHPELLVAEIMRRFPKRKRMSHRAIAKRFTRALRQVLLRVDGGECNRGHALPDESGLARASRGVRTEPKRKGEDARRFWSSVAPRFPSSGLLVRSFEISEWTSTALILACPESAHILIMPRSHKTRRWRMVVVANDHHVPFHDEQALDLFRRFLRREQPDWLILNGDFQDVRHEARCVRPP